MFKTSFNQRFGLEQAKPIDGDFPESARIALAYLIVDLNNKHYLTQYDYLFTELSRTGRFTSEAMVDFDDPNSLFSDDVLNLLKRMDWKRVFLFCERIYDRLLVEAWENFQSDDGWNRKMTTTLAEVREYYTEELNTILAEENIAYHFVDSQFQRRGRAQTQKSTQRVGLILSNPALSDVLNHYNKALGFFRRFPEPDAENCVKEALCALA